MKPILRFAVIFLIGLTGSVALQGCGAARAEVPADEFQITFKMDARLAGPTYGGERWVPAPYGPIAYSGVYTLEARTYYIDPDGRQVEVEAEWLPADPELVSVEPETGHSVTITIQAVGETSLLVKTPQGKSQTLFVKTTPQSGFQTLEISH